MSLPAIHPLEFIQAEFDLGASYGCVSISFPIRQPGASAIIGFFSHADRHCVAKFLRTRSLEESAFGRRFEAPPVKRWLRALPMKSNPFAPTVDFLPMLSASLALCNTYLTNISREQAAASLMEASWRAKQSAKMVEHILNLAFPAGKQSIDLFPKDSCIVRRTLPFAGEGDTLVLLQEDVTGGNRSTACYTLAIGKRSQTQQAYDALFLILASLAEKMMRAERLGIDLFPHFERFFPVAIIFPNILIFPPEHTLIYIDTFGLFFPEGNLIERVGSRLLYGNAGVLRAVSANLLKSFQIYVSFDVPMRS